MNAYIGPEKYLFVDYTHSERARVLPWIEGLTQAGVRVWFDEYRHGRPANPILEDHMLSDCRGVVSFVTDTSAPLWRRWWTRRPPAHFYKEMLVVCLDRAEPSPDLLPDMAQVIRRSSFDSDAACLRAIAEVEMVAECHESRSEAARVAAAKPKEAAASPEIPKNAVYTDRGRAALIQVVIPDGVTRIADKAFESCGTLKSVILSESVMYIGREAFRRCYNLERLFLPYGVMSIGVGAFWNCAMLKDVALPDSMAWIGALAFANCAELTRIVIPAGVKRIGSMAFSGCHVLKTITFGGTAAQWEAIDKAPDWDDGLEKYDVRCADGTVI